MAAKGPLREFGTDPVSGKPVVAKDGKFGVYVTDGETNASLGKGDRLEAMPPERAYELLAIRREAIIEKGGPAAKKLQGGDEEGRAGEEGGAAKKAPAKKKAAAKKSGQLRSHGQAVRRVAHVVRRWRTGRAQDERGEAVASVRRMSRGLVHRPRGAGGLRQEHPGGGAGVGARRRAHPGDRRDGDRTADPRDPPRRRDHRARRPVPRRCSPRPTVPSTSPRSSSRRSAAGRHVVSDRSVYSALAYQGYGRELDVDEVRRINDWAIGGRWPDLVVLLDAVPDVLAARGSPAATSTASSARTTTFHGRVADGFRAMAAADPERWVSIDAAGAVDDVTAAVLARRAASDLAHDARAVASWDGVVGQPRAVAPAHRRGARAGARLPVRRPGRARPRTRPRAAFAALLLAGVDDPDRRDARLALAGEHPDVREVERVGARISRRAGRARSSASPTSHRSRATAR